MRSRAGYWIGGGLVAAGVLGAVLWLVASLAHISNEVDDFQRVPVPGETSMQLEARKYVVYFEGLTAHETVPPFAIEITDAESGAPVAIALYGGSLEYSFSGHEGTAQATVTPPHAGVYEVRTESRERTTGASVAVGRSLGWPIARAILGTLAIGGLLAASGVTLLVITGVRRSRARRSPIDPGSGTCFSHPERPGRQRVSAPGNTGPLGQPRGVGFGILLFIVTFGIYSLYWVFKTQEETKQHTGEGLGGVLGLVVWLIVNPVTAFVIPSEIGKMYKADGREPPFTGWTGLWLFPGAILLVPAIIWFVKVQGALNDYWAREAPAPGAAA